MVKPYIIDFSTFGSSDSGYLSFAEEEGQIPFEVKRVYWLYKVPEEKERGNHAHKKGEQVLVAFCGQVEIELESPQGEKLVYQLKKPDKGLYVPGEYWRKVRLYKGAVLLSMASTYFEKDNYISDYKTFRNEL